MQLNHLDLQVADVQANVRFFEAAFGLVLQTNHSSPSFALLDDGHGFVLVLQRCAVDDAHYPPDFHVGFLVDTPEAVHEAHRRITDSGVVPSDIIENGRGVLVYCRAPAGFLVEVSCRRKRG